MNIVTKCKLLKRKQSNVTVPLSTNICIVFLINHNIKTTGESNNIETEQVLCIWTEL